MNSEEVAKQVIASLNHHGHEYMLVGSFATNAYCVPRGTQDIDIVVGKKFIAAATQISDDHPSIHLEPQIGFESVTATKRALLLADGTEFKAEIFELSDRPHDQERFARRIQREINGQQTWIATADDMVVTKLDWAVNIGRHKDMDDVEKLIATQADALDWPYIERWAIEHGTLQTLRDVRTRIGV